MEWNSNNFRHSKYTTPFSGPTGNSTPHPAPPPNGCCMTRRWLSWPGLRGWQPRSGRGGERDRSPAQECTACPLQAAARTLTFPLSVLSWRPVMTNLIPILATKGVQTDSYVQNHVIWQLMGTSSCACNPLCVKEIIAAGFGTVQRPQTKQPFYRWVDGVNSDIQVWRQSKEVGLYCLGWGKKTLWLQQSQDFWG